MILQELCDYYDILAADPESGIASKNYSTIPCSYAVSLDKDGGVKGVIPLVEEKKRLPLIVPEQKGRSGKNPPPYFLCDNSKYMLGFEFDKKEKKLVPTPDRLKAADLYHHTVAGNSTDAGLLAVLRFLKKRSDEIPLNIPDDDPIYQGGNIVFRFEDGYVHDRREVKLLWEQFCEGGKPGEDGVSDGTGQCLVTGAVNQRIAKTHTPLKNVANAQPSGCAIVSFNQSSFLSYGKSQSLNAPISELAMFKYTTALNALLANRNNHVRLAEATVVFWAHSEKQQDVMSFFLANQTDNQKSEQEQDIQMEREIADLLKNVREGKAVSDIPDMQAKTCILGLSPNMARVSVRFWYEDTFRNFILRMGEHQENMRVQKSDTQPKYVSISQILKKITPKSTTWWENVPAAYEHALFQAIVSGSPYPQSVYTAVLMRIRAETGDDYGINAVRAGYLKAVLLRNFHAEELTVSLNQKSTDTAYNLGRLFAVMEILQINANGTATIRSRYFASASVNPKLVFPSLLNLAQHHIAKSDRGGYYDKQMEMILSGVTEFPACLSLEDQGKFVLGYYHQREFLYMKKEDKEKLEA